MSQSGFRAVSERFQTYARSKVNNLGQAKGYFVNYKARRTYFRVLLCITKLADRTSQCYFVLQSLQNALPNTTLYCKARRTHLSALLCTTRSTRTRRGGSCLS